MLKQAIALLKARQPDIRVLLAVGGATYHGWDKLDEAALARLVRDLGADGVDFDFEPTDPRCIAVQGRMRCADDVLSVSLVRRLRAALPRPAVLSAAGWSVGAYGEGAFAGAPPRSPWTGAMLALLRSPAAAELDLVSIMSYDAGPSYRPAQAFRAYRAVWKGPLALGIAVMPSTNGGPRFTIDTTARTLAEVLSDPGAGAMLYALARGAARPAGTGQSGLPLARRADLRDAGKARLRRGHALTQCSAAPPPWRATTFMNSVGRWASGSSAPSSERR